MQAGKCVFYAVTLPTVCKCGISVDQIFMARAVSGLAEKRQKDHDDRAAVFFVLTAKKE